MEKWKTERDKVEWLVGEEVWSIRDIVSNRQYLGIKPFGNEKQFYRERLRPASFDISLLPPHTHDMDMRTGYKRSAVETMFIELGADPKEVRNIMPRYRTDNPRRYALSDKSWPFG